MFANNGSTAPGSLLLTPSTLAELLSGAAGPDSERDSPGGCFVQRFSRLPSTIDLPGVCTDVVIGHLVGPLFSEAGGSGKQAERRWVYPGQVAVTPAGTPVRRTFKGRPEVVLVHLDPERLRATVEDVFGCDPAHIRLVPKLPESDETADRLIRLLLAEVESPMAGTDLAVDALSRALIIHALRFHSNLSAPLPTRRPAMPHGRVRRVSDFMRANLDGQVPVARLAEVAGLSPSHFGSAFRDATGQSPHRFLVGLRVERACELLQATDLPIIEVGLRCGFAQPSHFATTFRKATGATPREWRRIRRE